MNLDFKIQQTLIKQPEISLSDIILYLKDSEYTIIETTPNDVVFEYNIRNVNVASKSDYYTKVDSGNIGLIKNGQETILKLSYQVSIVREFIFLTIIFVAGLSIDVKILFLSVAFIINFLIKINYLNKHILNDFIK